MQLTDEQDAVCQAKERTLLVNAFAGTGKTSTLIEYARRRPAKRMLYLAFNKAIKLEAERKFPQNVQCKTTHGLAFPRFGRDLQHKLGNPKAYQIASAFGWDVLSAGRALDVVNAYMASWDSKIGEEHVRRAGLPEKVAGHAVDAANKLWAAIIDTGSVAVPAPHDAYLKLYQLSVPRIPVDCILLDEAQDSAPTILDIVASQACGKVIVGDRYQGIYAWRGAINGMETFEGEADGRYFLTSSFRFGQGVADLASAILADWRHEPRPLRGLGKHATRWAFALNEPHTIIARTNAGLFEAAVNQLNMGHPFGFVGGVESYKFDLILDAYRLYSNAPSLVQDKHLRSFSSWTEFVLYVETIKDKEGKVLINIVETYGAHIPGLVDRIKREARTILQGDEVLMVTGHKAKGLEWENVLLMDDFTELRKSIDKKTGEVVVPEAEEVNLLYVAATRALKALRVNDRTIDWLREGAHDHLLNPIHQDLKALGDKCRGVVETHATPGENISARPAWLLAMERKIVDREALSDAEIARVLDLLRVGAEALEPRP